MYFLLAVDGALDYVVTCSNSKSSSWEYCNIHQIFQNMDHDLETIIGIPRSFGVPSPKGKFRTLG